jgi:hypothetical protein
MELSYVCGQWQPPHNVPEIPVFAKSGF